VGYITVMAIAKNPLYIIDKHYYILYIYIYICICIYVYVYVYVYDIICNIEKSSRY